MTDDEGFLGTVGNIAKNMTGVVVIFLILAMLGVVVHEIYKFLTGKSDRLGNSRHNRISGK